jgi:hypothetical protein
MFARTLAIVIATAFTFQSALANGTLPVTDDLTMVYRFESRFDDPVLPSIRPLHGCSTRAAKILRFGEVPELARPSSPFASPPWGGITGQLAAVTLAPDDEPHASAAVIDTRTADALWITFEGPIWDPERGTHAVAINRFWRSPWNCAECEAEPLLSRTSRKLL